MDYFDPEPNLFNLNGPGMFYLFARTRRHQRVLPEAVGAVHAMRVTGV